MVKLLRKEKNFIPKPVSLKDFYNKRNRILIWHDKGGLGDVLMQRMLFKDFKNSCPDSDLIFACLPEYIEATQHNCIKETIDSRKVNPDDYGICYKTCVTVADKYENLNAPFCLEHRSDIWAKFCGVNLNNHDMNFHFPNEEIKMYKEKLKKLGKNKPTIIFAPVSKMIVKTLLPTQIKTIVEFTKDYNLVGLHNREINELTELGIPGVYKAGLKEWMYYIAAADYVISVDTATFHMAGGLKKPLTGIFTFADGNIYGKYFDFILVQKHRNNGNWDCGPCFKFSDCPKCKGPIKPCLTELSSEELKIGIRAMFERWPYGKWPLALL